MKAASFEYHAPTTIEETVALLREHGDDAKLLAGGQSLVPILALRLARFAHLIDLNPVEELSFITAASDHLSIGAMTRQASAQASPQVATLAPLLSRAIPFIGHFQIRNRGTIGGSIAHADPASELPAVASALGAEMEICGPAGARRVPAEDFFSSVWETAVNPDEVLCAIQFPNWGEQSGFAIEELAWRPGDFAIAGALCAVHLDPSGRIERAGLALMGMGPTPLRAEAAEAALIGVAPAEVALEELAELAVAPTSPSDDVHASGAYRKQVARGLVRRTLAAALREATGA